MDVTKQGRWHHHLCSVLQGLLDLPEPPLFLCPGYTATVDFWVDESTQALAAVAEAYPLVWAQRPILDTLFAHPAFPQLPWQPIHQPDTQADILKIDSYRERFPQLWVHHNLVYGLDVPGSSPPLPARPHGPNYVLRLYVSGQSITTAKTLKALHTLLPQCLTFPYTLKVIDVSRQPDFAERDHVTATPTLVKVSPPPLRRLVGKLDDFAKLRWLLDGHS